MTGVEYLTGIASSRISESEMGLRELHRAGLWMVTNYLREKLAATLADECEDAR